MKRKLCSLLVVALMLASSVSVFAAESTPAKELTPSTPSTETTTSGAITPGAITPETVTPSAITPSAITPGAITPGAITPAAVKTPADVAGTVYEQAVKTLMEKGVVSGYADGTYRPANTITRDEACTFIVKYLAPAAADVEKAKESTFTDMKGNWAVSYVNYAVEKGIAKGSNGKFRPESQVTYDEMATMLVNALGYTDKDLTGTWPANYVNKAKELGIFADVNVANFGEKSCNRGDVALMVNSADKYKGDAAKKAAVDLLAAADKKAAEVKSMSYSMNMDMKISAAGETVSTKTSSIIEMIMKPVSMKMVATTDMGALGTQKMEMYMVDEKGVLMMYSMVDDKWTKQAVGNTEAMMQSGTQNNMDLYLTSYDTVRMEGKDMIQGKSATKLYCTLADDYLNKALDVTAMKDQLAGANVDPAAMMEMLKDVKGFSYYLWIDDASGMAVKYEIDMTEMMQQVMKNIADITAKTDKTAAEAMKTIKYETMKMDMAITGTDNVKAITLPEAAKAATPVTTGAIQ